MRVICTIFNTETNKFWPSESVYLSIAHQRYKSTFPFTSFVGLIPACSITAPFHPFIRPFITLTIHYLSFKPLPLIFTTKSDLCRRNGSTHAIKLITFTFSTPCRGTTYATPIHISVRLSQEIYKVVKSANLSAGKISWEPDYTWKLNLLQNNNRMTDRGHKEASR